MRIADLVERAALEYGERVAAREFVSGRSMTFTELMKRSDRLAGSLLERNLHKGERVGILLPNSLEWVETSVALARSGLVQFPLPLEPSSSEELCSRLEHVGASAVICDAVTASRWADDLEKYEVFVVGGESLDECSLNDKEAGEPGTTESSDPPAPDDIFGIRFTSGSTGNPKGVVHTQAQYAAVASGQLDIRNWGRYFGPEDQFLFFIPIESALQFLYSSLTSGVTSVLLDPRDQHRLPEVLADGITMTYAAPPVLAALLADDPASRVATLRTVFYGGAPMSGALESALTDRFGPVFVHMFAASEFPGCTITRRRGDVVSTDGSCGRPAFGVEARVVDPQGVPMPVGSVGEVEIRGDHVFQSYWQDPAATRDALRADGWARIGDLGVVGQEGSYRIVDRASNVVEIGGRRLYPSEIERNISESTPGVEAVVDVIRGRARETLVAVVYLSDHPHDREASLAEIRRRLDALAVPFELVESESAFDKSPVGKILRKSVVRQHAPSDGAG